MIFLHSGQVLVSILEKDKYERALVHADRPAGRSQSLVSALGKDSALL